MSRRSTVAVSIFRPAFEGLVDGLAGQDVLDLGAHEGRALAGLDVLEFDNLPELAVDHHNQAVLQIIGRCHRGTSLEKESVIRGQFTRVRGQIRDFLRGAGTRIHCCVGHGGDAARACFMS